MAKSPGRPTAADRASLGENRTARPRGRDHQPLVGVPRDPLRGRRLALLRQEAGRCQVDKAGSNHAGDTEQSSGDQDV